MKNKIFFKFLICFLLVKTMDLVPLQAKDIIVNGYYINLKRDTIKTKFVVPLYNAKISDSTENSGTTDDIYVNYKKVKRPDYKRLQWEISIINELGKKIPLLPSNCIFFQFYFQKDTLKFKSMPNLKFSSKTSYPLTYYPDSMFMQILIKGHLTLFQYFENRELGSSAVPTYYKTQRYCLMKTGDEHLYNYSSLFFREGLIKLIIDCKNFWINFENRVYNETDIIRIVEEYNKCKNEQALGN